MLLSSKHVCQIIFLLIFSCFHLSISAQKIKFTHSDTLRGSITPERAWWDVLHYNINITPDFNSKTISGKVDIQFKVANNQHVPMQLDLQSPLLIDSAYLSGTQQVSFKKIDNNVWYIFLPEIKLNDSAILTIYYHGKPKEAIRPPWEGGWIWERDSLKRPWMTVACQALGASVWYPCKDHQSDEPDKGALITINVADSLIGVSNGRFVDKKALNDGLIAYTWQVVNPINNYNIIPYVGSYVNIKDTLQGEKGILDLNYWVIDYHKKEAENHFTQVKDMLRAFEYWFGPYPFYEDGYKLVETSHLGMEHQSAIAYGNDFTNGYQGDDLSSTDWGLKWDFIIVHESGHEWFGNNITSKDLADMWIHESFTCYSETLFTEYYYGKEAGNDYCYGIRNLIHNNRPIIPPYNVNAEGSGDMYYKGANMLHSIRHAIDNDEKFRQILRGLNQTFYHQTVTAKQIEDFINTESGIDFSKVFDQYLRTINIPVLQYYYSDNRTTVHYRWTNCVAGFNLPLIIRKNKNVLQLYPTESWQSLKLRPQEKNLFNPILIERLYYINCKEK